MKTFSRFLAAMCLLAFVFSSPALADRDERLTPTKDDLTEAQLREMAAEFFSVKCGISKEALLQAQMDIFLWQPEGYDSWSPQARDPSAPGNSFMAEYREFPQWTVAVRSFPGMNGEHQGWHQLALNRSGELIFWSAHGSPCYEWDPDLLRAGIPAEPLPTDAKQEDILAKAQRDLRDIYGEDPDAYDWEAGFILQNAEADLPLWAVNAWKNGERKWKAIYGYNGVFISLVPAERDFTSYETPGEHFFESVYGDNWYEESLKLIKIQEHSVSPIQAYEWMAELKPVWEAWAKEHPYAARRNQAIQELVDALGEAGPNP